MAADPMLEHRHRTYALTLRFFAELRAEGVATAVVSPGSRSTPLVLAAQAVGLHVEMQIDERVAAFVALGAARASARPVVLICSSGTAGANYLPAVIEADHSAVPLIVCTADRPPELRSWGAGQTVEQNTFFGPNVRWQYEMPVASEVDEWVGRSAALRAVDAASGATCGPVHVNWPFREPLEPAGQLVAPPTSDRIFVVPAAAPSPVLADLAQRFQRGLIVAGPGDLADDEIAAVQRFAAAAGWPIVADPASALRRRSHGDAPLITTGEVLFSSVAFTEAVGAAEVVVRIGVAPTSKAYRLWLTEQPAAHLVLINPATEWADPTHNVDATVRGSLVDVFATALTATATATDNVSGQWRDQWVDAERVARNEIIGSSTTGALAAAAAVARSLDAETTLVVSSSMPIREMELVLDADQPRRSVVANRGANGIDGVVSTAVGVAIASGGPTTVYIGDVATVHDLGGLAALGRSGLDVVVVVNNNNGGAIFSFLPIARRIDAAQFAAAFSTPHGTDLVAVATALGLKSSDVADAHSLGQCIEAARAAGGPHLLRISTEADTTVRGFAELRAAVDLALAASP